MKEEDVNRLITSEVDEIEDKELKQFIRSILAFERSKMDRDQPHYRQEYQDLITEHALDD